MHDPASYDPVHDLTAAVKSVTAAADQTASAMTNFDFRADAEQAKPLPTRREQRAADRRFLADGYRAHGATIRNDLLNERQVLPDARTIAKVNRARIRLTEEARRRQAIANHPSGVKVTLETVDRATGNVTPGFDAAADARLNQRLPDGGFTQEGFAAAKEVHDALAPLAYREPTFTPGMTLGATITLPSTATDHPHPTTLATPASLAAAAPGELALLEAVADFGGKRANEKEGQR